MNVIPNKNAFTQVHLDWANQYNGTANLVDEGRSVAVDNAGFAYVTGQSENFSNTGISKDVVTVQYNPSGTDFQIRSYNGIFPNSRDAGNSVALDRSGNVYVAGYTQKSPVDFDFLSMKYSAEDTNTVWSNTYDGYHQYDESIKNITDDSGNVYVLGNSYDNNNVYMTIIKYDTQGSIKWIREYMGQFQAFAKAITLDRFSNVYVTGITKDSDVSDFNYFTIKYNRATGDSLWVQIYNPHPQIPGNDISYSIAADSSGNVYVTGSSDSLSSCDYATVKYNSAGSTEWIRKYNGSANDSDVATCVVINSLGNVCVSGYGKNAGTGYDYITICYSPSGLQQWISIYNGGNADGFSNDRVHFALYDNTGNIYITGTSSLKRSTLDYATIKLSSSGNLLWDTKFNVTVNANNPTMAIDPNANIFIAGSTNNNYLTIKYSQTPNAPSNLFLTPLGNGKIRLNWTDNSSNESGFKIQRKTNIDTNWIIKDSVTANTTQWQDSALIPGIIYYYTVYAYNVAGNSIPSDTVNTIITNVVSNLQMPEHFKLYQNHPNPFNPVTKIKFDIPDSKSPVDIKLLIYDISGKKMTTLMNQKINSGTYEVAWDASNNSSGIYYYTIEAGNFKETKMMLLIK